MGIAGLGFAGDREAAFGGEEGGLVGLHGAVEILALDTACDELIAEAFVAFDFKEGVNDRVAIELFDDVGGLPAVPGLVGELLDALGGFAGEEGNGQMTDADSGEASSGGLGVGGHRGESVRLYQLLLLRALREAM